MWEFCEWMLMRLQIETYMRFTNFDFYENFCLYIGGRSGIWAYGRLRNLTGFNGPCRKTHVETEIFVKRMQKSQNL
jgi:hypothetical protein